MHINDDQGHLSPSAFIPFCSFGGNTSVIGESNKFFGSPVCNKFKPKIRKGQLCYQIDVNGFKDQIMDKKDKLLGLTFLMDYNDGRMVQVKSHRNMTKLEKKADAMIYIETLGRVQ